MVEVNVHHTVVAHISSFYMLIVLDGFAGGPLNDDVLGVIATFLTPAVHVPVYLQANAVFGYEIGISMLAQISRAVVGACFIAELKASILSQAITGGTVATFKAGRACTGPHSSSFFRDWMLNHADNSYLVEKIDRMGGVVRTYQFTVSVTFVKILH